ncbi:MAG: PBP1A family penicillin-binding protein [Sphingomonadaceae bacterium]|nr:PBP1A family penicillin-binding protein [Sphingomonadaceae bacterium]NBU77911.1 PBP1A family penicillin-binding protein [Sphingomonadaceae bacterium]
MGLIAGAILGFGLACAVGFAFSSLPEFSELRTRQSLGQVIRVRGADGQIVLSLGPIYGEWLDYRSIPGVMVDAMIAVEDRRFRYHPGIDPIGMARAVQVRLERGYFAQGASTITQQLARNLFLTNTKTFGRKGREMILALAMEAKYSKDEILELYLNRVYFGGGAYGIDAASRRFFDHPANDLSLEESAIIAGLVKAPSNYAPTADAKAAVGRARVVLNVMADAGAISPGVAAAARPEAVRLASGPQQNSIRYFTDWALPQLEGLIDESQGPIEVWTTVDPKMQAAADAAIKQYAPEGAQGALVAIDRDGAVRAMVGGRDYVTSIYNRATQAVRQPGSAFKLFVYLAALEAGMTPETKMIDEPINIDGWSPRNNTKEYRGEMTLRTAFTYSINTIAAQIGQQVGTEAVAAVARRLGLTTPINTQPSMVLGTSDVRLIDLTRAFNAINAKGKSVAPYGILKVTTTQGAVLYERPKAEELQVVDPWVAAGMTDMMQTAVSAGTGRAAQIGRPVAGKTGTTSSNKDGWFVGFSSGLTTGVWMGRDDAKPVRGLQGGRAPATAFAAFMSQAVAARPVEKFETDVTLPEWLLESDEEAYLGDMGNMAGDPASDMTDPSQATPDEEAEYRRIIEEATRREAQPIRPSPAPRRDAQSARPNQ